MVNDDCSAVTIFMPFDDFKPPSVPTDLATYRTYRLSIEFEHARNGRISQLDSA